MTWWQPGGSFTCLAAYQAVGAASQAASYVNLANPGTFDLTAPAAPSWDTVTGWSFSGTQRLDTGIVPNAIGANATYIIRVNISGAGGGNAGRAFGAISTGANTFIIPNASALSARIYNRGGNSNLQISGVLTGGHVLAMAALTAYLDGSAETGSIPGGALPTDALFLGNHAAADRALGGSIQAFAVYSTTLDAGQVAVLTAAMAALSATPGGIVTPKTARIRLTTKVGGVLTGS